jgi:hypothetical protein
MPAEGSVFAGYSASGLNVSAVRRWSLAVAAAATRWTSEYAGVIRFRISRCVDTGITKRPTAKDSFPLKLTVKRNSRRACGSARPARETLTTSEHSRPVARNIARTFLCNILVNKGPRSAFAPDGYVIRKPSRSDR